MTRDSPVASDRYDLARFVHAQEGVYDQALAEIRRGEKRSHWMWFIFPQIGGSDRARPRSATRSEASTRLGRTSSIPCSARG